MTTQRSEMTRLVMRPDEATWMGEGVIGPSEHLMEPILVVRHPAAPKGRALIVGPEEDLDVRLGLKAPEIPVSMNVVEKACLVVAAFEGDRANDFTPRERGETVSALSIAIDGWCVSNEHRYPNEAGCYCGANHL